MSPQSLKIESDSNGFTTLWLSPNPEKPRGGVVVLDDWLISEIDASLQIIAEDRNLNGFILRSASERVFVAGADLAEIDALDDPSLNAYLVRGATAFGRIAKLPCPTVAILNSSALGGGLEIAMHCDDIVAIMSPSDAKQWRIGLPECGLGICPGWGGSQCLPARIDPAIALEATATGTTWGCRDAPSGLFAAVVEDVSSAVDAARVLLQRAGARGMTTRTIPKSISESGLKSSTRAALDAASPVGWPSTETGHAIADAVRRGLEGGYSIGCEAEREHLVRLRHSPGARAKLDAFLKRG